jgi:hypothetical protein
MTNYEFKAEYDKLLEVYPEHFKSKHKEQAIAAYVRDLDAKWFKAMVTRMILSSNPRLDIEDAARGERLAKQKLRATQETLAAINSVSRNISTAGLQDALKSLGVKSLIEAIETKKEGTTK